MLALSVCALLALSSFAHAQEKSPTVGQRIDNVKLTDLDGKTLSLHDFKDRKAIVVYFLTFDCPVSNSYLAESRKWPAARKRLSFWACASPRTTRPNSRSRSRNSRSPFRWLQDAKLKTARIFQAGTTPEVFVLDSQFRCAIAAGSTTPGGPAQEEQGRQTARSAEALSEVLAGKIVSQPVTTPVGCPISTPERQARHHHADLLKDVLPILQNRCQVCHRPGESGPFSLMTYNQAVTWASDIKEYTQKLAHAPWKPSSGVSMRGETQADRSRKSPCSLPGPTAARPGAIRPTPRRRSSSPTAGSSGSRI